MGTVIAFPTERCARSARESQNGDPEQDNIVVLPVIRVERHCEPLTTAPLSSGPGRTPRRPGSRS